MTQNMEKNGYGSLMAISAVLILLVSFLGCATVKFKNPFFAIPFGIMTIIFGFIFFITGFLTFGGASHRKDSYMRMFCPENSVNSYDI